MTKQSAIIGRWWIGWVACAATVACSAQSSGADPDAPPGTPEKVHTQVVRHAAGTGHRRSPISLAQTPVIAEGQPGTISLRNGKLTIHANDSELSQILGNLSSLTGMTVKGIAPSNRVFGMYGPGTPIDVLTQLLSGFNYDFIMAGVIAEGLPRELLLNARGQAAGNQTVGNQLSSLVSDDERQNAESASGENSRIDENQSVPQAAEAANQEPLGPGAIAHVPPNEAQGSGNPQDDAARVRQSLQRLQHIQERQGAPPQ